MGKTYLFLTAALLLGASFAQASENAAGVIVKYREGQKRLRTDMTALYDAAGVKSVRRFSDLVKGLEELTLSDNVKVQDAIAALQANPMVEYAQPNFILSIPEGEEVAEAPVAEGTPCIFPGINYPPGCDASAGGTTPSRTSKPALKPAPADVIPAVADPALAQAYGLDKIGAPKAWLSHKGSKDFVVAVIDTGIDYNHEDLAFNVWRNTNPGKDGDVAGYDFANNSGLPFDDNKHGTHTSGTIGAVGGNGIGVSGVAQRVSIMGVKFLTAQGSGTTANAVRAIDYAVEHGARVLSNSWGGRADSNNQALQDSITRAQTKGVLFVAAAGNSSADNDTSAASYPAAFNNDNIIAVAATDATDKMASFSNFGLKSVHVAAPGSNIYSTVPGGYAKLSGTSMACPHVAGAAALIWSQNPSLTYKQVKTALMNSVDVLPTLQGKTVTGGRINVDSALKLIRQQRRTLQ